MNVAEARHCAGCGHDLAAASPIAAASAQHSCPDCKQNLDRVELGYGTLFDCANCGGQFAHHELLRALLERREVLSTALKSRIRQENPLSQRVVYRPCPDCRALMNRRNFGGTSGIIVDICAPHGTWFDRGELPRVLAFVERGGLERARQLEAEAAERKRVPHAVGIIVPEGSDGFAPFDLAATVRELLDLVVELVRERRR